MSGVLSVRCCARSALRARCRRASSTAPANDDEVVLFSHDKDVLPEVEIKPLKRIQTEAQARFQHRFVAPSLAWYRTAAGPKDPFVQSKLASLITGDLPGDQLFRETLEWLSPESYVFAKGTGSGAGPGPGPGQDQCQAKDIDFYFKPSDVTSSTLTPGDVCVLAQPAFEVVVCVKAPSEPMDARFTFAKADGSLTYQWKSAVRVRFPNIFRGSDLSLIQREDPKNYAPVGSIKNDKNVTYIIPSLARRLLISNVTFRIYEAAVAQLPLTKKKLELLHRYLQANAGAWQIPFLKLVEICSNLDLSPNTEEAVVRALKTSNVSSDALYSLASSHFELSSNVPEKVGCSQLLSVYWALLHQQSSQMWGEISVHRGLFFPASVLVLPLKSQHLNYHNLIHKFRQSGGARLTAMANLINRNELGTLREKFPYLLPLLRDYAAGNLEKNETISSLVASLFRKLNDYKSLNISRDVCFDLLKRINPSEPPNPLLMNLELQLPDSNDRVKLEQKIYDLAVPPAIETQMKNRLAYKDLDCYCIDSEDAHEIDDAVSIQPLGDSKYRLFIHVADPVSLFDVSASPNTSNSDPILDIAYQRAFTTYLPDKVFPMMPVSYARKSDLGKYGTPTKAITFSVDCELSKEKGFFLHRDTFKIELTVLEKSKRRTYESVEKILSSKIGPSSSKEESELFQLYKVAKALRRDRMVNGGAILFDSSNVNGLVSLSPDENSDMTVISFKNAEESKSTILVSELMILANSMAASYFEKNQIPGIFRGYRHLNVVDEATSIYEWVLSKSAKNELLSEADITKMKSFLTSSFYSSSPSPHGMIGSDHYLTVTSPLRRFPDMVNHLQLHRHLRQMPLVYSQSEVDGMTWHMITRDITLKNASKVSHSYWTLKHLKSEIQDPAKNSWKVLLTSLTDNGFAHCVIQDKSFAMGRIKINPNMPPVLVGDTVTNCRISKIQCLDNTLEFEFGPDSKVHRRSK